MGGEGFLLDLWTTMLFFRYCRIHKIEGREARVAVLRDIVAKKKAKYIRDPKEFMQGKRCIEVRKKRELE